jgi:fucose permease
MGDDDTNKVSYNLALVPMIAYFASVLMSTRLSWFYEKFGRKKALFLGTIICVVCLVIMLLIDI